MWLTSKSSTNHDASPLIGGRGATRILYQHDSRSKAPRYFSNEPRLAHSDDAKHTNGSIFQAVRVGLVSRMCLTSWSYKVLPIFLHHPLIGLDAKACTD